MKWLFLFAGCDTPSKVGSKHAALAAAKVCGNDLLAMFGKDPITESMVENAEKYLLRCIPNKVMSSFDELRFSTFQSKSFKLDL